MKVFNDIHEAYLGVLEDVYFNPDYKSAPRGLPCREKVNYSFMVVNPTAEAIRTKDEERNRVIASYTNKEVKLYNSCTNRAKDFGEASKFWLKLANPDGTVNSAYGHLIWAKKSHGHPNFESMVNNTYNPAAGNEHLMRTPWEWCVESLKRDKDTRQAILRFSLPEHHWIGNKDFTCTLNGNFLIRDDKLHLSVVMRSNDVVKGLVYDSFWFCSLIDRMLEELRPTYPNLTKGTYTHIVHSLHIYESDEEKVKKMLGL